MIAWIDAKLASNGLAQRAILDKDARTLFRLAAEACVGIKEEGGNNKGPLVSLFQDTVGGPDPWAWCMSAIQTWLAYAEVKTGKKSPVFASESCSETWLKTPKSSRVEISPAPGAITIWRKPDGSGHTGVMLEWMGNKFRSCEGNTSDANMRDGDCVALKVRSAKGTGNLKVIGFLKPF
jgi:hypothetical protein